MFLEPIKSCRLGFEDEPKIGGDRRDANRGHTKHQRLADTQRFDETGDCGKGEQQL